MVFDFRFGFTTQGSLDLLAYTCYDLFEHKGSASSQLFICLVCSRLLLFCLSKEFAKRRESYQNLHGIDTLEGFLDVDRAGFIVGKRGYCWGQLTDDFTLHGHHI